MSLYGIYILLNEWHIAMERFFCVHKKGCNKLPLHSLAMVSNQMNISICANNPQSALIDFKEMQARILAIKCLIVGSA